MQTALHDPYAGIVPSAMKAHADRKARLERFNMMAFAVPVPDAETTRVEIHEEPQEDTSIEVISCNGQIVLVTENDIEEARAVFEKQCAGRPSIERILNVVAGHFNLSRSEFLSRRRTKNLVFPRQIAMFLAKELTIWSLPAIGRKFGGMDHTTILHAVRKITPLVQRDESVRDTVDGLRREIMGES